MNLPTWPQRDLYAWLPDQWKFPHAAHPANLNNQNSTTKLVQESRSDQNLLTLSLGLVQNRGQVSPCRGNRMSTGTASGLVRLAQDYLLSEFLDCVRRIARIHDQSRVLHDGRIVIRGMVRGNDHHVILRQGFISQFHTLQAKIVLPHFREVRKVWVIVIDAGPAGLKKLLILRLGDSRASSMSFL